MSIGTMTIKNACFLLCLFVSSVVHASPWSSFASLGSYCKSLFSRSSYDADAQVPPAPAERSRNNTVKYILGCGICVGAMVGYYQYRAWNNRRTRKTQNLAEALWDSYSGSLCTNEEAQEIAYWLSQTNRSNVNTLCCIRGQAYTNNIGHRKECYLTALDAAISRNRIDVIEKLLLLKPNVNLINLEGSHCNGRSIQELFYEPKLLQKFLFLGLDPNKKYDRLTTRICNTACVSLLVPNLIGDRKYNIIPLITYGAQLEDYELALLNDHEKGIYQKESDQVKKRKLAPLTKAVQVGKNCTQKALVVLPQNIAVFLTRREIARVASVCKA